MKAAIVQEAEGVATNIHTFEPFVADDPDSSDDFGEEDVSDQQAIFELDPLTQLSNKQELDNEIADDSDSFEVDETITDVFGDIAAGRFQFGHRKSLLSIDDDEEFNLSLFPFYLF